MVSALYLADVGVAFADLEGAGADLVTAGREVGVVLGRLLAAAQRDWKEDKLSA